MASLRPLQDYFDRLMRTHDPRRRRGLPVRRMWIRPALLVLVCAVALSSPAPAEVTSIEGGATLVIQEFRFGSPGDRDEAIDAFPGTVSALPIQIVAALDASANEIAAARAAAQFADPRLISTPNPQEFAINLALNSVTENTRYECDVTTQETRGILFRSSEVGLSDGAAFIAEGRLFIDGALTIYSPQSDIDLTGAGVVLRATIVRRADGEADETVFDGSVSLEGGAAGDALVTAEGAFPTRGLVLSDLAAISDEFNAFHVLIIPSFEVTYTYDAVVGQPLTLVASIEVHAANIPGQVGVAALVGTPVDALDAVISATQGDTAAAKMIAALQTERESPSGQPAILDSPATPLSLCGLFGLETLLGLTGLMALGSTRWLKGRGGVLRPREKR